MSSDFNIRRALLVTRNLPPLVGGMERLVWHIAQSLAKDYCLHVIGPTGCTKHLPSSVSTSEIPSKPLWLFLACAKLAAIYHALRLRPQLVFAGSGLTAPFVWIAARLIGARCVVYLHGLDVEARHSVYRLLWRPFFKRFDRVFVNSQFTKKLALDAGVPVDCIRLLHPGVHLPTIDSASEQRQAFRQQHDLDDAPVLLYVGRITARKGLLLFVRDILPGIVERYPDAHLIVIGDEPKLALHQDQDSQYEQIRTSLKEQGALDHVHFLGERAHDDPELQTAYLAADVLIFPVQDRPGDHEGFGMVAVEAAAHGLPTVAFNVGGVGDAIADGISGRLIPAGDNAAFTQAVLDLLKTKMNSNKMQGFAEQFSWDRFGQKLHQGIGDE